MARYYYMVIEKNGIKTLWAFTSLVKRNLWLHSNSLKHAYGVSKVHAYQVFGSRAKFEKHRLIAIQRLLKQAENQDPSHVPNKTP